jgi:hypothetical protein
MIVKPAAGLRVRDPYQLARFIAPGEDLDEHRLEYHRLIACGDLVKTTPAEVAAEAAAAAKKAADEKAAREAEAAKAAPKPAPAPAAPPPAAIAAEPQTKG